MSSDGALHAYQITPMDAKVIRLMKGALFSPNAKVKLPSGRVVTGAEMTLWTSTAKKDCEAQS